MSDTGTSGTARGGPGQERSRQPSGADPIPRGSTAAAAQVRVVWGSPLGGTVEAGGNPRAFLAVLDGQAVWVWVGGRCCRIEAVEAGTATGTGTGTGAADDRTVSRAARPATAGQTSPTAPLPGTVSRLAVKEGDRVEPGTLLVAISAMKMEHEIRSEVAGRVEAVLVKERARVEHGDVLVRIVPGK